MTIIFSLMVVGFAVGSFAKPMPADVQFRLRRTAVDPSASREGWLWQAGDVVAMCARASNGLSCGTGLDRWRV